MFVHVYHELCWGFLPRYTSPCVFMCVRTCVHAHVSPHARRLMRRALPTWLRWQGLLKILWRPRGSWMKILFISPFVSPTNGVKLSSSYYMPDIDLVLGIQRKKKTYFFILRVIVLVVKTEKKTHGHSSTRETSGKLFKPRRSASWLCYLPVRQP